MERDTSYLITRIAESEADLQAAKRLRYAVFVDELGGDGPMVDHVNRFECDGFDPHMTHLVLVDTRRAASDLDHVVGVYRLLDEKGAAAAGHFYSESEFDITPLRTSGRRLLELGRSCLHPDYRGGTSLYHLWSALAAFVAERDIHILFGAASFRGTDIKALAPCLSLLHHSHLAPEDLRVRVLPEAYQSMNLMPIDQIDRASTMRAVPALIKAYLRIGGTVGDGAFVDRAFNTTDVCLILDTRKLNLRVASLYGARG